MLAGHGEGLHERGHHGYRAQRTGAEPGHCVKNRRDLQQAQQFIILKLSSITIYSKLAHSAN